MTRHQKFQPAADTQPQSQMGSEKFFFSVDPMLYKTVSCFVGCHWAHSGASRSCRRKGSILETSAPRRAAMCALVLQVTACKAYGARPQKISRRQNRRQNLNSRRNNLFALESKSVSDALVLRGLSFCAQRHHERQTPLQLHFGNRSASKGALALQVTAHKAYGGRQKIQEAARQFPPASKLRGPASASSGAAVRKMTAHKAPARLKQFLTHGQTKCRALKYFLGGDSAAHNFVFHFGNLCAPKGAPVRPCPPSDSLQSIWRAAKKTQSASESVQKS